MSALLLGYARCSTDQQDLTAQRDGLLALGVEVDRIEASDELVEVSWCDLDTPPMGHTPLDIAIARWAIRHSPALGT